MTERAIKHTAITLMLVAPTLFFFLVLKWRLISRSLDGLPTFERAVGGIAWLVLLTTMVVTFYAGLRTLLEDE